MQAGKRQRALYVIEIVLIAETAVCGNIHVFAHCANLQQSQPSTVTVDRRQYHKMCNFLTYIVICYA